VHLGASPEAGKAYSEKRAREIWESFSEVVDICEEENVDLLLIAGDLFHRQPLLRELKEVNYLFSKLTQTQVVLIAGNHDYIRKDSYYLTFEWAKNVHTLFGEEMGYVEFPTIETCVYGLSYHSKEIEAPLYAKQRAKKRQKIEILLAHGGDEKHIPIKRQELAELDYTYIALGHIHKPMELLEDSMCYAGSLEPLDKTETGKHGYVFGEVNITGNNEDIKAVFIPNAKRMYCHEEIEVTEKMTGYALKDKMQEKIKELGTQHIYKMILKGVRDPEVLFDFEQMDSYGNIVEILDETRPSYDFEKLERQNKDNLLGKFIEKYKHAKEGSVEEIALYEGVQAILKTRR
jgi:DNA repair exonuclease